ncbi:MAG: CobW family GTP-binding protein [Betaproteobacteria bacterium]
MTATPAANARVDSRGPVPLTILTGFLGSGKTTLVSRILRESHGLRVAALVNDFGPVNIDAELVESASDDVISLTNGCICCTIRDDLVGAVLRAIDRPERPDYIVLEASGVAQPAGILATFADDALRDRIRLDTNACVVDAAEFFVDPELTEFRLFQVAFSDLLLLNKVDLVDLHHLARVKGVLSKRFSRCRVIDTVRCEIPLSVLMRSGHGNALASVDETHEGDHSDCGHPQCSHDHACRVDHATRFATWRFESGSPLSASRLQAAASRLPAGIYRAKGIVCCAESPAQRAILHVVGKRVDITYEEGWKGREPLSRVVAIGARGALVDAEFQRIFADCLA